MNERTIYPGYLTLFICGLLSLSLSPSSASATEETFPTLEVGAHVYTNVTVTTKAKNYIFIHHSTGMENIKVADLPEEIRNQLGYIPEPTKKEKASAWAKDKLGDLRIGNVKAADLVQQKWQEQFATAFDKVRTLDSKLCGAFMGGILLIHLLFCYCCLLICQKAGQEPGMLIWLPILQVFPLLRAARMSAAWAFASLLIVPALIAPILWCFKIAKARHKSPLIGLFLLLPPVNFFTFLYLAFADKIPTPTVKEDRRTDHLMTLETA